MGVYDAPNREIDRLVKLADQFQERAQKAEAQLKKMGDRDRCMECGYWRVEHGVDLKGACKHFVPMEDWQARAEKAESLVAKLEAVVAAARKTLKHLHDERECDSAYEPAPCTCGIHDLRSALASLAPPTPARDSGSQQEGGKG